VSSLRISSRRPRAAPKLAGFSGDRSLAQHGDREIGEQLGHRNRSAAVLAATGEHIAPISRWQPDPDSAPPRRAPSIIEPINQARHDYDDLFLAMNARKRADMVTAVFLGCDWTVIALSKQCRMRSAQFQQPSGHKEFLAPVLPVPGKICRAGTINLVDQSAPHLPIDRTAIVRVHHAEIPQLAALINVRHPRYRKLQDHL